MSERSNIWSDTISKASAVKVRNVMNPLLWLNAVAIPTLIVGGLAFKDIPLLAAPMLFAAVGIPLWTMVEYRYFARKDPQRLHSEEYLIEQQRLMVHSKSEPDPVDVTILPTGENPEIRQIEKFASDEVGEN